MRNSALSAPVLVALCVTLLLPGAGGAQSALGILSTYMERSESRLSGIDDILVVQSAMGFSTETYMEKVEVGGNTYLQARLTRAQGMTMELEPGSSGGSINDVSAYLFEVADRAELAGTEIVGGQETAIIAVDDLSDFDFAPPGQGGQVQSMEARSLRLFIDTDAWVLRRLEVTAEVTGPDGPSEATVVAEFSDFRDIEGMIYPFRMGTSITGLGGAVSAADLEQARQSLEQMEEQLANVPEQQRQLV